VSHIGIKWEIAAGEEKTMADESGPLPSLGNVIPSLYYDLIARVCSGVPFLVLLLWAQRQSFENLVSKSWIGFFLLLGAGYLAGLLLTPLSFLWNVLIGLPTRIILGIPFAELRRQWSRNDEIAAADKEAGTTLAKMEAEATLCQNLLSAFVVLIIANEKKNFLVPALGDHRCIIFLALLLAALFRTVVYLGRQKSFYEIYILKKGRLGTT
jgi:hypothetical protein